MKEKRLHKSRCEGILNNFIEARCSCGNCRCSVCPLYSLHPIRGHAKRRGNKHLFCFVQLFSTVFPADAQVKKNWPGPKAVPGWLFFKPMI